MVRNKLRTLHARMLVLAVDDSGMSTVEYTTVAYYTPHA